MRLAEGIMNDKVEKYNIPYRVIRSSRRTISVQIAPSGEVLVRCPRRMSNADIRRFVESKSGWIEKHLEKQTAAQLPAFTAEQIQVLARQARQTIPERVAHFAPLVGVTYGRITIRSQHTLWGSCSSKGNLNFNYRLHYLPQELMDYVVVHELSHRIHMNHSRDFWALVGQYDKDYKQHQTELRNIGIDK